jgi:hypothetical protein
MFEPLSAPVFARAKFALCGGEGVFAEIVTGALVADWFCASVTRSLIAL